MSRYKPLLGPALLCIAAFDLHAQQHDDANRKTAGSKSIPRAQARQDIPSFGFNINPRTRVDIGDKKSSLSYEDPSNIAKIDLAAAYQRKKYNDIKKNEFGATIHAGRLITEKLAIGGYASLFPSRKALGLNGIIMLGNVRLKGSGEYSFGKETYNFLSGSYPVKVDQTAYAIAAQYNLGKIEQERGLHWVGVSAARVKGHQREQLGPKIYQHNPGSGSEYLVYEDQRMLSPGLLTGFALEGQFGLTPRIVLKAGIGREFLKYPFADGSSEKTKKTSYDFTLYLEPRQHFLVSAGFKSGVAEKKGSLSFETHGWTVKFFRTFGHNLPSHYGAELAYNVLHKEPPATTTSLAQRMKARTGQESSVLRDVIAKPSAFPETFLLKPDHTAIKKIAAVNVKSDQNTDKKLDIKVEQGKLIINLGEGTAEIKSVQINGNPYADKKGITTTGGNVVLQLAALPVPTINEDNYEIKATLKNGTVNPDNKVYLIQLKVAPDKK